MKFSIDQEEKLNNLLNATSTIIQISLTISEQVQIIDKLKTAFSKLNIDENFDLRENFKPDNVEFIFGPPGSGKTTFLSKEISKIIEQSKKCKILVLTPSNKASDVLTTKLLTENKGKDVSWIWRFVTTNDPKLELEECVYDRSSEIERQDKVCVLTTTARFPYDGFNNNSLREIEWDFIIIDEASMIPLIHIMYPYYKCPESKFIIAGDPFQIHPIVKVPLWDEENIYKMINLNSFIDPRTEPHSYKIQNLNTQYRSIPAIGELFSQYSYSGELNHFRNSDLKRKFIIKKLAFKDINFITFPVNSTSSLFEAKKLLNSNVHLYSVLFCFEFLVYISKNMNTHKQEKVWTIGVICPYRNQVEIINKLWGNRKIKDENVVVNIGTVHGFQGDECDFIIALYNPPASGMVRNSDKVFINKQNILNVAISRAKDTLFILMPNHEYEHYNQLYELRTLGGITCNMKESVTTMSSNEIENVMFDNPNYIEDNTFVTMHQMTNVYDKSGYKYEIRIDENSVDVQIN